MISDSGALGVVFGSFRNLGVPYFGVLIIKILQFRVLYSGPLFSETPISELQERGGTVDRIFIIGHRSSNIYSEESGALCPLWMAVKVLSLKGMLWPVSSNF